MSAKSTWWSVTAYNSEIVQLESADHPEFVARILGGREKCPETDRIHFQGAVQCRRQVRLSQLKAWLPTAHWEPARNVEALKKYAMKEETAAGEKKEVVNSTPHVTVRKVMEELSAVYDQLNTSKYEDGLVEKYNMTYKKARQDGYWRCVRHLLQYYDWARDCSHLFARADVKELYFNTRSVWICPRGVSITHPEGCKNVSGNPGQNIVGTESINQENADASSICSQEEFDSPKALGASSYETSAPS